MKRPAHGEELMIRYHGSMLKARCSEVTETPTRGCGSANFTIVSGQRFARGEEAALIKGADELTIQIDRVTVMGHRTASIVEFHGTFDFLQAVTEAPKGTPRPQGFDKADWNLPLERINSAGRYVVYSAEGGLISEHAFQGDALKSLSLELTQKPASKAAMFERRNVWIRLL